MATDSPAIAEVVRTVYEEYGWIWEPEGCQADLYDIGAHYLERGHSMWVACLDGTVVGVVALKVGPRVPGSIGESVAVNGVARLSGCDAALARLYVLPEARRRGIGSALVGTALSHAQQRGARAVEVWSDKQLVDAHRLYAGFGARTITQRWITDPDPCEEWGLLIELVELEGVREAARPTLP